jgi:hypothetical protein
MGLELLGAAQKIPRVAAVLIVACPCALGLATPMSMRARRAACPSNYNPAPGLFSPVFVLRNPVGTKVFPVAIALRDANKPDTLYRYRTRVLGSNGAEKWHREMLREQQSELQLLTRFHNIHRLTSVEGE